MSRKPAKGTFAETYHKVRLSVRQTSKSLLAKRRMKMWEAAVEDLTVQAFEYGVQWALEREWTEHQKRYVLGQ